jgi:hypothetical protein
MSLVLCTMSITLPLRAIETGVSQKDPPVGSPRQKRDLESPYRNVKEKTRILPPEM